MEAPKQRASGCFSHATVRVTGSFMVIMVVSDCQTRATRIRQTVAQTGYECPPSNVISIDAAAGAKSCFYPKPDLILFILADDSRRSCEALQHLVQLSEVQIIAVGPRDPNLILGALHAGAASYLDETSDLERDLAAALSRLSSVEHRPSAAGRVTAVVSASGGSGRTLVAANLAVALAKRKGRCGLFDFDLLGADLATCFNLKPRHTIADLCRSGDKFDQKMFEQSLVEHESGVWLLAAPESWEESKFVTLDGLQKTLRLGRSLFPDVVVDFDAFSHKDFTSILQQCSSILLLVRLDFSGLRNARRALAWLERSGVDQEGVWLVGARTGRSKEISASQVESALGMKIRASIPEDPHAANTSLNCGVPVLLETPNSSLSKAIVSLGTALAAAQPDPLSEPAPATNRGGITGKVRTFLSLSLQELSHVRKSCELRNA
jgi:pilus assembly protein CpaE